MKILKSFMGLLAAGLLLAGCGGGNTLSGAPKPGGGGGSTVATVTVKASPTTVAADGSTTSSITATALDANNAGVAGAAVTFASSTGGAIAVTSATTDANGNATATLSNLSAAAGTNLTVSATAGGVMGSTTVGVVATQQTLSVVTSDSQIPSDSSKSATITALLKDANNNVLKGVPVVFSASSGSITPTATVAGAAATPAVPAGTTDANGTAQALVNAGHNYVNRTITVTVNAGTAPAATVGVNVTGTTLTVTGPANLVLNNTGTYTVTLADSAGAGIPNQTVTMSSANGNTLGATTLTTGANGQATVTLKAVSTANSGKDTLTAAALGLSAAQLISVSSQNFAITTPANTTTNVNLGVPQTITATWTNNGAPVVGQTVTFSATRGTLSASSAVTSASGTASVTVSSTNAGPAVIQASGTGVTASVPIYFIATNPTQIVLQATPASVNTQATSTITATVRDPANNLVAAATVNFTLTDTTGGSLSSASATTDQQGQAQIDYTAGNATSAANGVSITGTVAGTAVAGTVKLTVGGQAVFLSLGTGNKIVGLNQETQYQVEYAIQAIDAQGAPVANVPITVTILPDKYVKGQMGWNGTEWCIGCFQAPATTGTPVTICANEDINHTGIYQVAEDINNNGRLDPGNVASVTPSSGTTDATGTLIVTITYPSDHAFYVQETLTATATVSGTQSSTATTFYLEGAAADYTVQTTAPPGPVSPYGIANVCTNPN